MVRMSSGRWAILTFAIATLLIATSLAVWSLNANKPRALPRAAIERLNAMAEDAGTGDEGAGSGAHRFVIFGSQAQRLS